MNQAEKGSGPIFEAIELTRNFRLPRQSLFRPRATFTALDHINLEVRRNETFGIVGESGSGKSTLMRLLMALDTPTSGEVRYDGRRVSGLAERELRHMRREVQIVLQDPVSSLNPRMRVKDIIADPLRSLSIAGDHEARVAGLLTAVGLPAAAGQRYPHQFSGGQRQRIAIARALATQAKVIMADEPVSALDVSVRAQVLNLLLDLKEQFGLTIIVISHDLSVVRYLCDRVAVMRLGSVVESGDAERVYTSPQHPYTKHLLESIPTL